MAEKKTPTRTPRTKPMANETLPAATSSTVPAYLQGGSIGAPRDNFDGTDIILPQVRLLQGTSDAVANFDTAKPGNWWHDGADLSLGSSMVFTPVKRRKKILLVAPMIDGRGVLARSEDAQKWDRLGEWDVKISKKDTVKWAITDLDVARSGLAAWGTSDPDDENSPPAATLFYEYLVAVEHEDDMVRIAPAVLLLKRSSIRAAKKGLNDKIAIQASAGRPMQALRFRADVGSESNEDGQDYFVPRFRAEGFVDEERFRQMQAWAKTYDTYKVADEEKAVNDGDTLGDADVPF